jgi:hypothetical protein
MHFPYQRDGHKLSLSLTAEAFELAVKLSLLKLEVKLSCFRFCEGGALLTQVAGCGYGPLTLPLPHM